MRWRYSTAASEPSSKEGTPQYVVRKKGGGLEFMSHAMGEGGHECEVQYHCMRTSSAWLGGRGQGEDWSVEESLQAVGREGGRDDIMEGEFMSSS